MVKLLLGAAVALAAFAVPAAPARADHPRIATAVSVHVASHGVWRGDRWRGGPMWRHHDRWRGGPMWRHHDRWRGDRWHRPPPRRWRGPHGFVWREPWRNPCRSLWFDGWSWRCRW